MEAYDKCQEFGEKGAYNAMEAHNRHIQARHESLGLISFVL